MAKTLKVGLASLGLVSSYVLGDFVRARIIRKKLENIVPLLQNAIVDVMTRAVKEDMSREDVSKLMNDELTFIEIIAKKYLSQEIHPL